MQHGNDSEPLRALGEGANCALRSSILSILDDDKDRCGWSATLPPQHQPQIATWHKSVNGHTTTASPAAGQHTAHAHSTHQWFPSLEAVLSKAHPTAIPNPLWEEPRAKATTKR